MSTPNPYYNANWKNIREEYLQKAEETNAQRLALISEGNESSNASIKQLAVLEGQAREWQQKINETDRMQHETVAEYGAWLFGTYPISGDEKIAPPDFDYFISIEEVEEEWRKLKENYTNARALERGRYKIGQPDNLDAFEQNEDNNIITKRHWFRSTELYGYINTPQGGASALVTYDFKRNGDVHICVMDDFQDEHGNLGIDYSIDKIATILYREIWTQKSHSAEAFENPPRPSIASEIKHIVAGSWLGRKFSEKAKELDPKKFHFYIHIPPAAGAYERFYKVHLEFKLGRFEKAEKREDIDYKETPQRIYDATEYVGLNSALEKNLLDENQEKLLKDI